MKEEKMRIEPKILDWDIEKKSLYEKRKNIQPEEVDSYSCLFGENAEETLSHLQTIDDEDRYVTEQSRKQWQATELGKATINTDTDKKMSAERVEDSLSITEHQFDELSGLLSDDEKKKLEEHTKKLEDMILDAF